MCSVTHVECKITFIGLDNEVWKVGSVLNEEQRELEHSNASYAILNCHISPLASHLYQRSQSVSNKCIKPI